MDIFIIREGRQAGPYSEDAVKAFLTEGTVRGTDMGWRKGMAEWRPVSEVLKARSAPSGESATPPLADEHGSNGTAEKIVMATAKQKALLKYLGAEFGENLEKGRAALAISDAIETPKLQSRIRKWHDEKLRQHPEVFQDEIDFRRANRSIRYLERIQAEGAEVLKDVTKAHVQVIVESLDKRHPGWESQRESALWDYLLPALGEHFPQLVLPAYKNRLKVGGTAKIGSAATRGLGAQAAAMTPPPAPPGTFGAMLRGVALGVIALGAIVFGRQFLQDSQGKSGAPVAAAPAPPAAAKSETPAGTSAPISKAPPAQDAERLPVEATAPAAPPANAPAPPPTEPAPMPTSPAPVEPAAPTMSQEKPAVPPVPEEKQMPPAAAPVPTEPAPMAAAPAAPPQRTAVKLLQGIGVMLSSGQVTLPAGTPLRYLGTEGQNIRVSWNNNVFFVPAIATDLNEPIPVSAATAPAAAPSPKKAADDL